MGAVMSRYTGHLPTFIKYTRGDRVFSYTAWHGVGISRAARDVARVAKESELFDDVALVTAGKSCSPRKLQLRIAQRLGILRTGTGGGRDDIDVDINGDDDEEEETRGADPGLGRMIYEALEGPKMMLILHDVREKINLQSMGVPIPRRWSKLQVLVTCPSVELSIEDETEKLFFPGLPEEVFDLFREEAEDVAKSLNGVACADDVFHSVLYLCLFPRGENLSGRELSQYYIGEGLVAVADDGVEKDRDLEAAFEAGERLLGELEGRWMVDKSDIGGKFLVKSQLWEVIDKENNYLRKRHNIQLQGMAPDGDARWIALTKNKIQGGISPNLLAYCPHLSTLLLSDNLLLKELPDDVFKQMPNLRVLDLSRTHIPSLPTSTSRLVHLRLLKLQECPALETLPPMLKHLKSLIILDIRGTPLLTVPQDSFGYLPNLRIVDLSRTAIPSLPTSLSSLCNLEQLLLSGCESLTSIPPVDGLKRLQVLDLSCAPKLQSLPTSIFGSISLKKLVLAECSALEVMIRRLLNLSALEELDLSGCRALSDVENVSFAHMPKLRAVDLCRTKSAHLSFRGCANLESVRLEGLTNLKSLDLSRTRIRELPPEISRLTLLERLDLMGVAHLKRVQWDKIKWLPKILNWDQCDCSAVFSPAEKFRDGDPGASISVSDASIFRGFSLYSHPWRDCFSKFHFYISPCSKRHKKKDKLPTVDLKRRRPLVYARIHSKISPPARGASEHLEIEGVDSPLHRNITAVVKRAKLLSLRDCGFLKSLSDLEVERMGLTEECRVERCHNMESIFHERIRFSILGLRERLWVSDMGALRTMYDGDEGFPSLTRLHLNCCPRLVRLFPRQSCLKQLRTLHVRFCGRLEYIFGNGIRGEEVFPKLHALYLWELPKLNRICDGSLPNLLKFRARGCSKLQWLPRLGAADGAQKVEIEGELDWWASLRWDNQQVTRRSQHVNFRSNVPPSLRSE